MVTPAGKKTCFRCNEEKDKAEFYSHKKMADGLFGKCKECTKSDMAKYRSENTGKVKAYDRWRYHNFDHRKEACLSWGRDNPEYKSTYQREWARNNSKKVSAHSALNRAVRTGALLRGSCESCASTENVHGHHYDYGRPLDVQWLCVKCHAALHRMLRERDRVHQSAVVPF